jgi:hypothetical protein
MAAKGNIYNPCSPRLDPGFKGNDSPSSLTLSFVLSFFFWENQASSLVCLIFDLLDVPGTWGIRDPASLHPDECVWS